MEGPEIQFAEAVIDNGRFGTRTVRFETGRIAKQAAGAAVAYLDGELDSAERQHVEAWLAADAAARDRLAGLAQSATLVRSAYADIVNEAVPERLIAAARGESAGRRRRP